MKVKRYYCSDRARAQVSEVDVAHIA
jgi:hypothetical protein